MDAATLRFEPLREEHIEAVLAIEQADQGAPWSAASFRNEINHQHAVFLVAFVEGEIVGYVGVWLLVDEAHITTVMVRSSHRRAGLGERLVREALRRARDAGMTDATLEVRAGNVAAIQLYEKLGFQRVAVRKRYYPDNHEDAVVMWLYRLAEVDL